MTAAGRDRKVKIIAQLFVSQKKTLLELNAYRDIFPLFSEYIKLFQSHKPLMHELHVQMVSLVKKFLSFFLKHEIISSCKSYKYLRQLDIKNENNHLSDQLLFVGAGATKLISVYKSSDYSVCRFKETLKKAYVSCSQYMLEKLPYGNSVLIALPCLDPQLRGQVTTLRGLLKLANFASSVLTPEDVHALDKEVRFYQIDDKVNERMVYNYTVNGEELIKTPRRIDEYWADVFAIRSASGSSSYPILTKLVKAALSCFHGPVVEGAFSFMENTITEHRTTLDIEGLDSYQTIKYYLMANNVSSVEAFFSTECPETDPVERNLLTNMINSWQEYQTSLKEKNVMKVKGTSSQSTASCSKSRNTESNEYDARKYEKSEDTSIPSLHSDEKIETDNVPRKKSGLETQSLREKKEVMKNKENSSQITASCNKSGSTELNEYSPDGRKYENSENTNIHSSSLHSDENIESDDMPRKKIRLGTQPQKKQTTLTNFFIKKM